MEVGKKGLNSRCMSCRANEAYIHGRRFDNIWMNIPMIARRQILLLLSWNFEREEVDSWLY